MASSGSASRWDELPDEIVLQILSYLDPFHITRLQLVSRKLQKLCLDDELWKHRCFEESIWYQRLKSRRRLFTPNEPEDEPPDGAVLLNPEPSGDADADDKKTTNGEKSTAESGPPRRKNQRWQELQDMANWDPTFPDERVSWYNEYIQRNGPTCVNWLQTPRIRDRGFEAIIEARGMELYCPYGGNDGLGTMLAVSPLDDGSICLWDVKGTRNRAGSLLATSKSDILFIDGPGSQNTRRSKRVDTGVTECVSVDNHRHRAYFAVQSHLIEIDLERLEVVSRESFEWSITALSKIQNDVPLTVGTSLGIHLHDPRARARVVPATAVERVDQNDIFKSIFDPTPLLPYAPLSQPTPVSIVHLPLLGSPDVVSNDIYVAGRFSNILHYDRRKFPVIMDSIYSGATINSMAALPHPFSSVDSEVRRHGELSTEQVAKSKESGEGWTLIAGGTYKSKGSLELFGLSQAAADSVGREMLQNSTMKNRQTAASASILSVANHGTKIVFSDGAGSIKWFERDGLTECRQLRIGNCEVDDAPSLFASMSGAGELGRKIVSTQSRDAPDRPNDDNILFWTGERLGMVSFTPTPLYLSKDFDDEQDADAAAEEEERRQYAERIREALDRQADEVRFMNTFGHGGLSE